VAGISLTLSNFPRGKSDSRGIPIKENGRVRHGGDKKPSASKSLSETKNIAKILQLVDYCFSEPR